MKKTIYLFYFFVLIIALVSCTNDDISDTEAQPENNGKISRIKGITEFENGTIVTSDSYFEYGSNGFLETIKSKSIYQDANGNYERENVTFKYIYNETGEKVIREHYTTDKESSTTIYTYNGDNIIKSEEKDEKTTTYLYNEKNNIFYSSLDNGITKEESFYYYYNDNNLKNVIKPSSKSETIYIYDTQKSYFKGVFPENYLKINLLNSSNNITNILILTEGESDEETINDYLYNDKGYPVQNTRVISYYNNNVVSQKSITRLEYIY